MFVERNKSGEVVAVYANPQPGKNLELLPADHPDVVEFLKSMEQ